MSAVLTPVTPAVEPDLSRYDLPMQPIPASAREALGRGITPHDFPGPDRAAAFLTTEHWRLADGAYRAADGRALALCTTAMPGVTPAMIDWWFGWHMPESARYRLWHPQAHRASRCRFDRQGAVRDRDRYIGNVSYVDELIGNSLRRLAIAFQEPARFGFESLQGPEAVAICATTADRILHSTGGCLVHYVSAVAGGAEMRSAFWLGEASCDIPLVGGWLTPLINRPMVRRQVVNDTFLLALLRHCAEEMNHLPRFLPGLFHEVTGH